MRNLLHISLDKLELLPSRQKSWQTLSSKFEIVGHLDYYRRYRNRAENTLHCKIRRILEASVGKDWNEVHSKICSITKYIPYDFDVEYELSFIIQPVWSARNQRWEFHGRRWGRTQDLADHIQHLKRRWSNHSEKFYYVCPKSNIVRMVKSAIWKKEKNAEFYRKHYTLLSDRRRKRKALRKEDDLTILRMINHPQLFQFYCRLVKDYKSLLKKEEDYQRYMFRKQSGARNSFWDWEPKPTTQDRLNLDSYKRQIEDLEKGNFNVFFESAVYLYAQQKECHHFETP